MTQYASERSAAQDQDKASGTAYTGPLPAVITQRSYDAGRAQPHFVKKCEKNVQILEPAHTKFPGAAG